uniref:Pleckstrin homology domain containing, family A member 7b n=1 Tax=Sphaeramia orbicularis TaxID=375764 RepID=A0A673D097_9TELE
IMAAPLGRDTLPDHWSYGVCRDGRVFFINDKTHTTTWLHPRTGEPVNSGHMIRSDLPRGWEEGFTDEGASYFINHNVRATSFRHPVTGQISPDNTEYTLQDRLESRMSKSVANHRSPNMVAETTKPVTSTAGFRGPGKVHSFGKRDHAIKRNLNIPVVVRGWLYKQDSSGMRLWKRKWFVLSDYCLFYYKDSREETVLGSIPLPSYVIAPIEPDDHINRKYAFKASHTGMRSYIYNKNSVIGSQAEHCGMRTYFFSADTQEDMNGWIRAMNQAALMQQSHTIKRLPEKVAQQAVPQTNHVHITQNSSQSESLHRTDREEPQDNGIRLAHGDEVRYGVEVHGRPNQLGTEERVERLSPDSVDGATHKNGQPTVVQVTLPPEQNGNVVYQRGFVSRTEPEKHVQRKNTLAQVEQWVKVQKGDPHKRSVAASTEYNLPRRTPPLKPKANTMDATYQSLPKSPRLPSGSSSPPATCNLPSDYKYAHDRLSHFRMSTDERMATKEGMVWQLYEWQQRQQFRHGSPTAPIYSGPNFTDSSSFRVTVEMPRSISVPPSPCEVPPSVPSTFKPLSPRRPHTPSDRRTVRPLDETAPAQDSTRSSSPGHICTHLSQVGQRPVSVIICLCFTSKHQGRNAMSLKFYYVFAVRQISWIRYLSIRGATVKLSRLCEQDKILQELEARIRTLKEDKDKLESVLDVSHQQMEQYRDQPAHAEKIAYQQKLLQEDVVHIRAEISQVSTEMENAWNEYNRLERDVDWLKSALQGQMNRSDLTQQEKVQIRKELWRIEDVIAGLSSSKANYKVTISSVTNPERKFVPSVSASSVPSVSGSPSAMEMRLSQQQQQQQQHSPHLSPSSHTPTLSSSPSQQPLHHSEDVPPRPPLPQLYSPNEHPPAVPPLPRETTVIRHTSVRGLKRQSDERKRDREIGQFTNGDTKIELRPFLSDPELMGDCCLTSDPTLHLISFSTSLPSAAPFALVINSLTSHSSQERPKSALERLYSGDPAQQQQRGKMSADEQLERMKRHQKALVRQRKRTLSHGDRHASSSSRTSSSSSRPLSADLGSWKREQDFDLQLLERAVQGEEAQGVRSVQEVDLEPLDYDLDLSKELSKPQKVLIPERYVDSEPEEPLSPQEVEERHRKVERIKSILAKSSVQNLGPTVPVDKPEVGVVALDSALQEQERIITMSYALASEASLKSKLVAGCKTDPDIKLM